MLETRFKAHQQSIRDAKPLVDVKAPFVASRICSKELDFAVRKQRQQEIAMNDLRMVEKIAATMTRPFKLPKQPAVRLSHLMTRDQARKINEENHRLLSRLENSKPIINTKEQLTQYQQNQKYMVNSSYTLRRECQAKLSELKKQPSVVPEAVRRALAEVKASSTN